MINLQEDDGEANTLTALVSGLTLYLIPSSATDRFDLYAQIRSSDPELVWRVDLEETMTQWYQLFLFPASPFLHPDTVHQRLMDKLFRNLVFEMHEQGILDEIASIVLGQSEAPSKSAGRITEPGPLHAERYSDTARKAPIGDH